MSAMRGKCLNLIHCYQDFLWAQGDKNIQPPMISSQLANKNETERESSEDESIEKVETEAKTESEEQLKDKLDNLKLDQEPETADEENQESQANSIDHEQVLTDAFLASCKFKSKEIKFPLIVSTFMKIMQTCW